ncbi:MAG: aminotransferase class V-fold PLP-dependent enzyme [Planctomycetota bacterium]|nr:aminotransferase class V-fold PLP-dependent enzyme [Planctomycetota bacterium]
MRATTLAERPPNNAPTLQASPAAPPAAASASASGASALASPRGRDKTNRSIAPEALRAHWSLDPAITFLNHGSYGATPTEVQFVQQELRRRIERDPVRFYKVDLEPLMDEMRERLAGFLNCDAEGLAPFPNATQAIGTILHSIPWQAGDEVVVTDHEYMSLVNELRRLEVTRGIRVVTASIPFPLPEATTTPRELAESVTRLITSRTRLVAFSWITSATSLVLPAGEIVQSCNARGVDVLVDGTHAPGQIPVDIASLAPTYFVGSGHKWLSTPKGVGFLWAAPQVREQIRPLALSSRAHKVRADRSLFLRDFDYHGTSDVSGVLCLPAAIDFYERSLGFSGFREVMSRNALAIREARSMLARRLAPLGVTPGVGPQATDAGDDPFTGTMASFLLPEPAPAMLSRPTRYDDPLQDALVDAHRVQIPVWRLASDNRRVFRVSAQVYNSPEDYQRLADALEQELTFEQGGSPRG